MPQIHTLLQTDIAPAALWLCVLLVVPPLILIVLWAIFRRPSPKNALWFIKNDSRIAQIVMQISYLDGFPHRHRKTLISRKRFRLEIELRLRIREFVPDAKMEEIQIVCKDLCLIARRLRKRRENTKKP